MLESYGVTEAHGTFLEHLDRLLEGFVLPAMQLESFENQDIDGHEMESWKDEVRLCYEYVRTVHDLPLFTFENYGHDTRVFLSISSMV